MDSCPTLVVLAAGMGSRFGGPKQITPVGPSGETLMEYSVFDAARAGFGKVVFVVTTAMEQDFRRQLVARLDGSLAADCALQDRAAVAGQSASDSGRLWGTAHALIAAEAQVDTPLAVINADDFYGHEAFDAAGAALRPGGIADAGKYFVVGYPLGNTLSPNGPVSRAVCRIENGRLAGLTEHTRLAVENGRIVSDREPDACLDAATTVSMNFWGFTPDIFDRLRPMLCDFVRENAGVPGRELYLPEAVGRLIAEGEADVEVLRAGNDWFGMTYEADLADVRLRIAALVDAGVYPPRLWA